MPMKIFIDSNSKDLLTDQIVNAIKDQIDKRMIRTGMQLPSIRKFALDHRISRFTVVQAYDRLVAMAYLNSRRGSGFYVAPRHRTPSSRQSVYKLDRAIDVLWLLRNSLQGKSSSAMPGDGWLPGSWLDEAGIKRSLRTLSGRTGEFLTAYGTPEGYLPLREVLQHRLSEIGVRSTPAQIVLTKGATHALDLLARYFIRPGDHVLVDDPGHFILFGALKSLGANIVGVPWGPEGPDTTMMEAMIREHRPKMYFTNTVLHNPTGASISQAIAYRVLKLAERFNLLIVEDDIYGDFHPSVMTRLATLDQLERVIYIGSFSKTISASTRVGFLACKGSIAESITDLKLLTGFTTSEIGERLVYQLLIDGYYRKHLDKLRGRLQIAREKAVCTLEKIGFVPYLEPEGGIFVWAKLPDSVDAADIASMASEKGVTLAPGGLFLPQQGSSPWFRFNVASFEDSLSSEVLSEIVLSLSHH